MKHSARDDFIYDKFVRSFSTFRYLQKNELNKLKIIRHCIDANYSAFNDVGRRRETIDRKCVFADNYILACNMAGSVQLT